MRRYAADLSLALVPEQPEVRCLGEEPLALGQAVAQAVCGGDCLDPASRILSRIRQRDAQRPVRAGKRAVQPNRLFQQREVAIPVAPAGRLQRLGEGAECLERARRHLLQRGGGARGAKRLADPAAQLLAHPVHRVDDACRSIRRFAECGEYVAAGGLHQRAPRRRSPRLPSSPRRPRRPGCRLARRSPGPVHSRSYATESRRMRLRTSPTCSGVSGRISGD